MAFINVSELYDLPELKSHYDDWHECLRKHLRIAFGGDSKLPPLRQICGWPLVQQQPRGQLRVVAVPHYGGVEGCGGSNYSAALVVHDGSDIIGDDLRDLQWRNFAVNDIGSCSGYLLPAWKMGYDVFDTVNEKLTGAHLQSCSMVNRGECDFASIDCVSLAHFKAHRPEVTNNLRIIRFTDPFPAPPYVTDSSEDSDRVAKMRAALNAALRDPEAAAARKALFIGDFSFDLTVEDYENNVRAALDDFQIPQMKPDHNEFSRKMRENEMKDFVLRRRNRETEVVLGGVHLVTNNMKKVVASNQRVFVRFRRSFGGECWITFPKNEEPENPWFGEHKLRFRDCVLFFGRRPRIHRKSADYPDHNHAIDAIDQVIAENLPSDMLSIYFSSQFPESGIYYNMVVFKEGKSAEDFRNFFSALHGRAIGKHSPFYYDRVWIHRAKVNWYEVQYQRTLALQYQGGEIALRKIFHWNDRSDDNNQHQIINNVSRKSNRYENHG